MKGLKHYGALVLGGLIAIWGLVPLLLSIAWLFLHLLLGGFGGLQQSFYLMTHNLGNPSSAAFWFWVALCMIASLVLIMYVALDEGTDASTRRPFDALAIVAVIVLLGSLFQVVHLSWQNSKNVARFYDRSAVIYTPSINNAPGSLQYLLSHATKGKDGCYVANSDVPSCVKIGSLPMAGFDPRVSSSTGALTVMQRTSGSRQNVNLLDSSLTYLNGNGKNGVWSALRDGFGAFQPTEGVVEWNGTALPTECKFGGADQFNKALNGVKSNSLVNYLTKLHPDLYWSSNDVWGYCSANNRPVLVFPVEKQARYLSQTVSVPAGVLVITGSRSGKPQVSYLAHARNMPGPVYPKSLADTQLTSLNWMAGRAHLDRSQFGFEPTNSSAQAGNTQDYLLKSKTDGHIYWVTPLTLASSQSQLFVAYSMVRADTVNSGQLNTFKVYALASSDTRVTNVDQLEAQAKNFMVNNAGGFIPSGGQLIEFTPANGNFWRAFGEINGRVIYRLDISTDSSVTPVLVSLDPTSGAPVSSGGTPGTPGKPTGNGKAGALAYCGNPVSSLNNTQKLACLRLFANSIS
jgi:hypothetical protein